MIVRDALSRGEWLLTSEGGLPSDEARREATLLLSEVLERNRAWLLAHHDERLPPAACRQFEAWIARRAAGEPVAHILGKRAFWTLELKVTPDTLIPRPETELLVEAALEKGPQGEARVLDLGTGTGAIACALAKERAQWQVMAVEASDSARHVAEDNVQALGLADRVEVRASDWFGAIELRPAFDLIVSNPPYIEAEDPHLRQGDVRFEPRSALVAGVDGLEDIRHIMGQAPRYLKAGGWLILEHGWNQRAAVRALFDHSVWDAVETRKDYAGHDRITLGQLKRPMS
ncbi:MAG: peptide chain release factor N(5)-glutamine methyltransferase [Gammaproteobacteria bacterium]|nr:MAG: peptide chain release factor N(5)-glutamine methyltransferase [Gammaproteobacteria bacterium]